MAHRRPARASRYAALALALPLGVLLGACAGKDTGLRVVETASSGQVPSVRNRFGAEGLLVAEETDPRALRPAAAPLGAARLAAGAPRRHTVVRGDTLWDISARFLDEPWLWPTVWEHNPQIADPHRIYPGDVIALDYTDGEPVLRLERGERQVRARGAPRLGAAEGVTRLAPSVRSESLDDAVPMVSGDTIRQFLIYPRVLDIDSIESAPYVIGNVDGRLIGASGNRIYARGDIRRDRTRYRVYRRGEPLTDPATGELLGHEIAHVADAQLLNIGDPSTFVITGNERETINGDILLPAGGRVARHNYATRLPTIEGEGRIVSLVDAISQSGRNQVVVLNVGERAGIAVGDVLAVESRGGSLIDRRGRGGHERVTLPNLRTGVVMVFETFEKVSYALVMESTRPVRLDDIVTGI